MHDPVLGFMRIPWKHAAQGCILSKNYIFLPPTFFSSKLFPPSEVKIFHFLPVFPPLPPYIYVFLCKSSYFSPNQPINPGGGGKMKNIHPVPASNIQHAWGNLHDSDCCVCTRQDKGKGIKHLALHWTLVVLHNRTERVLFILGMARLVLSEPVSVKDRERNCIICDWDRKCLRKRERGPPNRLLRSICSDLLWPKPNLGVGSLDENEIYDQQ